MKILLFEWMMGGGMLVESLHPDDSCTFQSQGRAMLRAVVDGFHSASISYEAIVPVDVRLLDALGAEIAGAVITPVKTGTELKSTLVRLAREADRILLIAPESEVPFENVGNGESGKKGQGGKRPCLEECVMWLQHWPERMMSPGLEFVRLASDKTVTCDRLEAAGIRTPTGRRLDSFQSTHDVSEFFSGNPFVLKPNWGAGSEQVQRVDSLESLPDDAARWRVESFCSGRPASVAVLNGRTGRQCLPPMFQVLKSPMGAFVEARPIEEPALSEQIQRLALRVMEAFPDCVGYVGIDLLIGDEEHTVIEVNPRLTASYSMVCQSCDFNVAEAMARL